MFDYVLNTPVSLFQLLLAHWKCLKHFEIMPLDGWISKKFQTGMNLVKKLLPFFECFEDITDTKNIKGQSLESGFKSSGEYFR